MFDSNLVVIGWVYLMESGGSCVLVNIWSSVHLLSTSGGHDGAEVVLLFG